MYLWIILGLFIGGVIVGIVGTITSYYHDEGFFVLALACGIFGFVFLILFPIIAVDCSKSVAVFEQQKAYIETHEPENEIEDAALTTKKVDLNSWLYRAQYSVEHHSGWTFYSKDVLNLKPIE